MFVALVHLMVSCCILYNALCKALCDLCLMQWFSAQRYHLFTLYLQSLGPPQWAQISLTPGQSCCPPAWPQYGGQRVHTAPSASAPHSHKWGVWWCRRPARLQQRLCNTCLEEIGFIITPYVTFRCLFFQCGAAFIVQWRWYNESTLMKLNINNVQTLTLKPVTDFLAAWGKREKEGAT